MQKGKKEKKTVLKVFWPFVLMVVASGLLAAAGFLSGNLYVAAFFTLITLYVSYPLYNPNIKLVFIGSKGYAGFLKKDAEKFIQNPENMKDEPGIFSYTNSGFSIAGNGQPEHYAWDDINCMVAYKRNNFTTDCICLDIFCINNGRLQINEEIEGWSMFIKKSKEQFPQVDKIWDIDIASPPFKTNLTLVYDRQGRTLEEVMETEYSKKQSPASLGN